MDATFPSHTPGPGTLFRAHTWRAADKDGGCWFFTSLPAPPKRIGGRFDLLAPRGTCYWASTELAAARERIATPGPFVAHDVVDGAYVSTVQLDPGQLADLLHADAARRGVTQELASSTPYELAQRWASAFDAAGFDGIRYQPRFSSERVEAVACFGVAGKRPRAKAVTASRPVADVLAEHGYTIIGAPRSTDLSPLID